jgi:hypothetical protein
MMRCPTLLLAVAMAAPTLAPAQAARELTLGAPTAINATEFAMIGGLREFRDGSIMIADPIDNTLYRIDAALKTVAPVGRNGAGPGEYKQPDAVFALPGDSLLVTDLGNGRLMEFDARMRPGRTMPIASGGDGGPGSMSFMLVGGVDSRGNLYFRARQPGSDSSSLMRYDRDAGTATMVARLKETEVKTVTSGGPGNQSQMTRQVPFSPQDGWAIRPDGAIYVVRVGDYHVDVIQPDGRVVRGAPVEVRTVPISTAEKEEFVVEQQRTGGISIGIEVNNGQRSVAMNRGRGNRNAIDGLPWPEAKPAFNPGAIWVDGKGRLWVHRYQRAGQPWLYDVFGTNGAHLASVRMPAMRRVVGMGTGSVYVARFDADDLQYLERYTLPN